nr:neuroblastoma breakpoint family member 12-like isoform X5 [Callithrix jacchus]
MIASGRTCSRKTTEANFPDAIENSYSQQEETKPNIGASKNRLLLSQVAYFLNYQLKTYRDRNNHDEEQKGRDSKNKLLMSQVAYYLGCRLKTEVPGYLCSAPNVSTVTSGKPPSRENTEVNIAEGIEKSCSRQEENKPTFRASKNRLFLSQVAYFLNYRLKTYGDRKDHNEEQKCRDSKNKLLMSQVAYYLGCRLKTEVPGYLCSAPNISTAASGKPPSGENTEVNVAESIEISCSWQEENKPTFRASKIRLLLSQVAYFLNYQLKTYRDRKDHDEEQKGRDSKNKLLMSQVAYYLGCRLKTEVPGYLCSAPNVSPVASGRPPSRKNTEVNIPEDIEKSCSQHEENKANFRASKNRLLLSQVAYFLNYQLKTYRDRKDHNEEQKYRDSKNKLLMSQVAYYLGCRLKTEVPGYLCSAPNISTVTSGKPPSREDTEALKVAEGIEKSCSQQEENKPTFRASKNRLLLNQVAYFLNYQLKTYRDRKDHDEEQKCRDSKNKLLMSQVAYYLGCRLKTEVPGFLCSARNISKVASGRPPSRRNTELNTPEGIEKSWSRREDNKPNIGGSKNRLLMSQVDYSLNYRLKTCKDRQDHEIQKYRESKNKLFMKQAAYYMCCRLKIEEDQRRHEEEQKYRDSKNKLLMSQDYPGCRLKTEKNDKDEDEDVHVMEAENIQESRTPRNLQEYVEEEAPEESWDEDDSTLSIPPGTFAFNEPYRTNLRSLEEQQVNLAHDIDTIKKVEEEEEDQGPLCPRLSMELVEAEEPEVFWYSLDILYSTYTAHLEFYYTCQAYTYAVFLYAEEHVRLTLDMDSGFLTMTVIGLHLVSRIGVIFPH